MNAADRPLVFHPKAENELAARLRGAVQGELLFDRASRGRYSTDASIYQIEPVGVLVPRSHDDVRAAVDVCRELRVPLLPRGAGSSQCGQTVGAALVIDHSKHLTGVIAFDREAMTVTVEPGIVLDTLNAWLRPHGVWFPVDVSTSAQATLGGMAGNNSCGSRSIAYGNMVHNVLAADVLLVDGTEARLGAEAKMSSALPRVRALVDGLRAIGERERDEIERRVPKVMRRVGGYNLDVFHPQSERPYTADRSVNLAQLLVGSEGTLAWTRTLTLKLAPLPRHRALGIVSFPTLYRAMELAQHIVRLDPSAVELVDRTMIELARGNPAFRPIIDSALVGEPDAILLVEFMGEDAEAPRPPARGAGAADGRPRPARPGRADDGRRRAEGAVGRAQGGTQHHDEHEGRRQAGVLHRGLRGAARAPRRLCRAADRSLHAPRHARHLVCACVGRHAACAPDPRHAAGWAERWRGQDASDRRRGRGDRARIQGRVLRRAW